MLPNFLLVGGMKCGTTSLAQQIVAHPEVFIPPQKELHFFSEDECWAKGVAWYESFFQGAESCPARGEASTTYTMRSAYPRTAERVAQVLPQVRFIYIVRNPLKRLLSHYLHEWYEGRIDLEPEEAVEARPDLVDYGRYYFQMEPYLQYFPAERWLVMLFDDFVADPVGTTRRVFSFLGVAPEFVPEDVGAKNVTQEKTRRPAWMESLISVPGLRPLARRLLPSRLRILLRRLGGRHRAKPTLSPDLRRRLADVFLHDAQALSPLVGRDVVRVWKLDQAGGGANSINGAG